MLGFRDLLLFEVYFGIEEDQSSMKPLILFSNPFGFLPILQPRNLCLLGTFYFSPKNKKYLGVYQIESFLYALKIVEEVAHIHKGFWHQGILNCGK